MEKLWNKLEMYGKEDWYPYHMPGHKRQSCGNLNKELAQLDITEIDGFDNLHDATGILEMAQKKAARIFGSDESYFLINGSSCGILTAISSIIPEGGRLLVARNTHKSVYHGAYLRNIELVYLYPTVNKEFGFYNAITKEQVQEALNHVGKIDGILIVSPTYEGVIADVKEIVKIAHSQNIPVIVDEAHGAHLGFHEKFSKSSIRQDADVVIQSLHKTLPSLTQTAILHFNYGLVQKDRIERFLKIYQSSSPSYLLMAAIDNVIGYLEEEGRKPFEHMILLWEKMLEKLSNCKYIKIYPQNRVDYQDIGKLIISVKETNLSGKQLYDILLVEYHLQMELVENTYVLAMFTIGDTEEGYQRLTDALLTIDSNLAFSYKKSEITIDKYIPYQKIGMSLSRAWDKEREWVPLIQGIGRIAGDFINLYPPGIPLVVPGEIISENTIEFIKNYMDLGIWIQGIEERNNIPMLLTIL